MPRPRDQSPTVVARRGIRWDALAAIIASIIGLLALVVAGYTAHIQRQQVRAQVWPYVQLSKSNADGRFELGAINKGVGPAIVKTVQVTANGKPVLDWAQLFRLFGYPPPDHVASSTLDGVVLAPGEHLHWIAFQNLADVNKFLAGWQKFHVEARVCYVSTLGESWVTAFDLARRAASPQGTPVAKCPAVTRDTRFSD